MSPSPSSVLTECTPRRRRARLHRRSLLVDHPKPILPTLLPRPSPSPQRTSTAAGVEVGAEAGAVADRWVEVQAEVEANRRADGAGAKAAGAGVAHRQDPTPGGPLEQYRRHSIL